MALAKGRHITSGEKCKTFAIEVAEKAVEIIEKDKNKIAVLLCEGTTSSIDVFLYSAIYPEFIVVPVGGCTDVRKLMPFMKKYFEYPTFGIIDRDGMSKSKIRSLEKNENVYCTKLPFIENIVCCPEVIKIMIGANKKRYNAVLEESRERLIELLAEKMSLLNPFNIELPYDKEIQVIDISIISKKTTVHKKIDLSNVLYTVRDKAIVSIVADAMQLHGREDYFRFFRNQIYGENGKKILQAVERYLPSF